MDFSFDEFKQCIREAFGNGTITCPIELTDFDLAVQYALYRIGERTDYRQLTTVEEIYEEIRAFAPELLEPEEDTP